MPKISILHGADLHLDSPFESLPPEQARQRRREQRELPDRLCALARSAGVQLILLSGDLLDGGATFYETTQALADALGRAGVPVFIAPGNHDYYHSRSPYAALDWPGNVHIFQSSQMERVVLEELGCVVYGCAFTSPLQETSLLERFTPEEDGELLRLMVLHGELGSVGKYNPITEGQLAASGMDYAALGHVHRFSGVLRAGNTFYAYPGCPEGRGFDETGDKGVLLGTVEKGDCRLSFVPLCRRRYLIRQVDLTDAEDPAAALAAALPQEASPDICRILLTGSWSGTLDLPGLETMARKKYFHAVLRDRTTLRRDLWARWEEDTLTGLFLREMAARLKGADSEEERLRLERAVRFGMAALEGGEEPL